MKNRISLDFYQQNAVTLAQQLLQKTLVRKYNDNRIARYQILITEAYQGEEDKACHASKGRTSRTEIMYARGGFVYVYLIYGIHWLFNVVCGAEESPQAVLICGLREKESGKKILGSGRVGKILELERSFYGENLLSSKRIYLEYADTQTDFISKPRQGIDYAGEWKNKLWRFEVASNEYRY